MNPKLKQNYSYLFDLEAELALRKQKEELLKAQVESLQIDLHSVTSSLESSEYKHSQFLSLEAQVTFHRQTTENLMERELLNLRKIASLKSEISGLLKK